MAKQSLKKTYHRLRIDPVKRNYLTQAIMISVYIAGTMAIIAIAPKALELVKPLKRIWKRSQNQQKYYISKKIKDLIKKDLLVIDKNGNVSITATGENFLAKETKKENINNKADWDGKWRVIIFDIKERERRKRDYFRIELQESGFIKLQNSVWISPFPNDDLIELLKQDLRLQSEIIYFEATKIPEELEKILSRTFFH
ncbi:MAG: hypothetical protein COX02_01565 [Candidatus Vogelbacteria bacterium CG22_combo_CG10-13_8_21_14_all_37_9]|uniref:Transcriptional repressor PaaX-like central Cas2-like domain-containing protein n=1 Tax=Candidatus Vogelbacteria bacterium CG22_combo_CG10-13_8_21_14_all_37_9 TaxID=1975046 RepID=A0A2H0BKK5_9BACT|nr:MAG: hypothetical protein COX02_01565 [Candidatus Vogelbacteria bacterium CG22_combo_CG10-13_8_21_14_all_37_9]